MVIRPFPDSAVLYPGFDMQSTSLSDELRAVVSSGRVLLWGEPGSGKSTLARYMAQSLSERGQACVCLCADPGSPAFGVPGAVSLGSWNVTGWRLHALEALCSLDAARYRLPLLLAIQRLLSKSPVGPLLLDPPGVVRGNPGMELLQGLLQAARIDAVVGVSRPGHILPLEAELRALSVRVIPVTAAREAHNPTKVNRTRWRTRLWDAYLADAGEYRLDLHRMRLLGAAPTTDREEDWQGRQCGLILDGSTIALGEAVAAEAGALKIRLPKPPPVNSALLVRDAVRGPDGKLNTRRPARYPPVKSAPPDLQIRNPEELPGVFRPVVRLGDSIATLVNGVLGDPLLHLRARQKRRSVLFDLGEGSRLPTRIAHQVSDVFVSHCHFDHIGGFLWLLRSRIGKLPVCRLWGPPGLAGHIGCLVQGILWDRVGDWGPRFEIGELRGERLSRWSIQAGQGDPEFLDERKVQGGLLLDDEFLRIRAVTLDHGVPVLAYALETRKQLNVSKARLKSIGLAGGTWLRELKQCLLAGERHAEMALPDGSRRTAADLERDLIVVTPGRKLVYATDFADSMDNRRALQSIARGADILFLEAGFTENNRTQALNTSHLTARACGEIAAEAHASLLVPFHFSRRYESDSEKIYQEVSDRFPPENTLSPCRAAVC